MNTRSTTVKKTWKAFMKRTSLPECATDNPNLIHSKKEEGKLKAINYENQIRRKLTATIWRAETSNVKVTKNHLWERKRRNSKKNSILEREGVKERKQCEENRTSLRRERWSGVELCWRQPVSSESTQIMSRRERVIRI